MKKAKHSAIKALDYMGTELAGDGILNLKLGFQQNVSEIIISFRGYSKALNDMADQTLICINKYLHDGHTEKEILDEFNKHFTKGNKYNTIKELIEHYESIGI